MRHLLRTLLLATLAAVFFGCEKDQSEPVGGSQLARDYSSEVPLQWFQLFEDIDRYAPGYRPPAAARALGYIGLAAYEAAAPGMPDHFSVKKHYAGLSIPRPIDGEVYHWPSVVNAAYNTMFERFYPHIQSSDRQRIRSLNRAFEEEFAAVLETEVFNRSKYHGIAVANAVFEWSESDEAGHNAYLDPRPSSYVPPAGPGLWQPTAPNFLPALFPYWGQVRPFAMRPDDLLARPPLPWSEDPNSQFYGQAKEVEVWVNRIKAGEDEEGHWIAEFWSDDFGGVTFTPAGRWVAIANQVVAAEQPSLETAVELYAKLGMALCDAGVAIWYSKYTYNVERPVQYINRVMNQDWKTIMNHPYTGVEGLTPEFPAYPSGHSGFGGAAAAILTDIFGYNYRFTDYCHEGRTEFRSAPRSFGTFVEMAVENAYSRIPLGVHYRMDCDEGLRQGYLAGQRVLELRWK